MRGLVAVALTLALAPCSAMELVETSSILTIREGEKNVLSFRQGDQLQEGVDPKYTRSCYIHPLYTLNGEPLTDDFPADHYHHRGIFWSWPVVKTRGVPTQNWHPVQPSLRQHFVRWLHRSADDTSATVVAENRWLLDEKEEVAREKVTICAHPESEGARVIDVEITLEAVGGPLTVAGTPEGKKGYGGFSFRGAPWLKGATMTSDLGPEPKDLENQRRKWVSLSGEKGSIALLTPPEHPGYPAPWLARNSYAGYLNVSWPGLEQRVLQPGSPVTLRYRLLVHQGTVSVPEAYSAYTAEQ